MGRKKTIGVVKVAASCDCCGKPATRTKPNGRRHCDRCDERIHGKPARKGRRRKTR